MGGKSKVDRELARLADHNKEELGAAPARVTGEQQEEVKEVTTRGVADKLNQKTVAAAEERRKQFQETRQIHTPQAGSKSVGGTPVEKKLASLGYAEIEVNSPREEVASRNLKPEMNINMNIERSDDGNSNIKQRRKERKTLTPRTKSC